MFGSKTGLREYLVNLVQHLFISKFNEKDNFHFVFKKNGFDLTIKKKLSSNVCSSFQNSTGIALVKLFVNFLGSTV